uniref:DUF819 domain-containing protein n=1 Tax=Tetradesmus obliquus TaxID=3088 RepID=A0A383V839_TETOB|eukprot:jgi/Sobl393_1/12506/SZX60744.1
MNCCYSARQLRHLPQQHRPTPHASSRNLTPCSIGHFSVASTRRPWRRRHCQQLQAAAEAAVIAAAAAAAPAAWCLPLPGGSSLLLPCLWPAAGPWGVWVGLVAAGAFGMWSERTRLGRELSGALVATLAGMFLANAGYMPPHPPEADTVFKFLLPLAVPLLLLGANMRRILAETGPLLAAFLLGSAATAAGSVAAMALCPLTALGEEGWKIAAALTARHIGGAVNYMVGGGVAGWGVLVVRAVVGAVAESLGVSPSTFGAGLAADDLILTLYFVGIYSLARNIPPEAQQQQQAGEQQLEPQLAAAAGSPQPAAAASSSSSSSGGHGGVGGRNINVYAGMMALALAATIAHLGTSIAQLAGAPSQALSAITALSLAAASAAPRLLAPLAASGEGLALMLMQVFFAAVGSSADIRLVVATAPVLFAWSALALGCHLGLLLGLGRLAGFSRKELLLASNANIGGPSTVAGMAAAKGWPGLLVPAVLVSSLGYGLGSAVGLGLGGSVLRALCV